MQQEKLLIFVTFGGHLRFLQKMKKCEYLENCKRWSNFEQIFDLKDSTRVSYAKGKNWIFAENEKV